MDRVTFERALDSHKVKARVSNGNLWMVKRNGKTRTWKRDADRFEIPIKMGFKSYGLVTQDNINSDALVIID